IEANLRAGKAGPIDFCVSATAEGGIGAKDCASTNAIAAGAAAPVEPPATPTGPITPPTIPPATSGDTQLEIEVTGPELTRVGDDVNFTLRVTNRGQATASRVVITDRFATGLKHKSVQAGPIEGDLGD